MSGKVLLETGGQYGTSTPWGGVKDAAKVVVVDSLTGQVGSAGSHAFGYDGSGNLVTDTWTVNGVTYVKTFSYTNGVLTGESAWVKA